MIKNSLTMLALLGLSSYVFATENDDNIYIGAPIKEPLSVIERMQQLRYTPNLEGMCYGLAAMGAQAVLRKDGQGYYDRIQNIASSYNTPIDFHN